MTALYIGLMSGTSLDGVDGVLVDFSSTHPVVLAHAWTPFAPELRRALADLNRSGSDELHRAALAANALARDYAAISQQLLDQPGCAPSAVRAIGVHGQTVRHQPQQFDGTGYTLQLNNPALLAELTNIDVVADFRSRDVAAGGQGAPLAPFFHHALLSSPGQTVGVLNLGGIANLTVLPAQGPMKGFDCGPANTLMDGWCARHTGADYDADGAWAAQGLVCVSLLAECLACPYFELLPPKSTGRDLFNLEWLDAILIRHAGLAPVDVQATLAELTARSCADALNAHALGATRLVVCGGGALNLHLMRRLASLLSGVQVCPSDTFGLPVMQVEAMAFAWLAYQMVTRTALDLPSTTGAQGARVLGAMYPA